MRGGCHSLLPSPLTVSNWLNVTKTQAVQDTEGAGERFVFNPHSSLDRGRKVSPVECLQLGYKVNRFDARSPCLTNAIGVSNQETISCSSSEFGGMLNVLWDHSVSQVICGYCEDAYWTIPGYFLRQLSDYPHSTRHTIIQYSEDNNTQYTAERIYPHCAPFDLALAKNKE